MLRVRGRLAPMEGYPALTPTDTREIVYSILSDSQRQRFENNWQLDFAYQIPGKARFRVNAYFQRSAVGRRVPPDPVRRRPARDAGTAAGRRRVRQQAARAGARDRSDRLGQVDHAGVADRRDQRHPRRAHHDDRGPDRVPAQAQEVHGQPARARVRRDQLRRRAEGRAAPGPRRDPRRRDARPRDDRHRDHRGGDRPPRVRDAAHAGHPADDRPHHRRVPGRAAGADPRPAGGRAAGDHDPDAAAHGRRRRPLPSLPKCWSRPPPCAT